jgi:microcystin-dependent protein
MKQFTLFFACTLIAFCMHAQNSGKGFSYQAVARGADGEILISQNIELQFGLYPGQGATTPSWQETHVATTDQFGVFSVTVGKGIKSGGDLENYEDLNYGSAEYWLKTEIMDDASFQEISFSKLLSAPYAEYAANASVMPPGTIVPFGGDAANVPEGWLLCDGSEINRTEYADLFAVISVYWGHGDASSTFNVPDLRGLFLRGVDDPTGSNPAGEDPDADDRSAINDGGNAGDFVGSYQIHNTESHRHSIEHNHPSITVSGGSHSHTIPAKINDAGWGGNSVRRSDAYETTVTTNSGGSHSHSVNLPNFTGNSSYYGGNETRPVNAYVNYIIKY